MTPCGLWGWCEREITKTVGSGRENHIVIVDRAVDFTRERAMLCAACGASFSAGLDWIETFSLGEHGCPRCGLTCEHEGGPQVTVRSDDVSLIDSQVAGLAWYHTSTGVDWPSASFDPARALTPSTIRRMGGARVVAEWRARQRQKALHVGTYEAAIHNMLRRMADEADCQAQFYLYRVELRADVTVRAGWLIDPSDGHGDVVLADVCPDGIDVARYLNYHEDPGGISLALARGAIATVQQWVVPLPPPLEDPRVADAIEQLARAAQLPPPEQEYLMGIRVRTQTNEERALRRITSDLSAVLPLNLQDPYRHGIMPATLSSRTDWARRAVGVVDAITEPHNVLTKLSREPVNHL